MPITIPEHIKLMKDPLVIGLYQNLLRQTDVLKVWPWVNHSSLVAKGVRWNTLPTPDFRKIGGSYTDSTGTTVPIEESLAIYGSTFTADRIYGKTKEAMLRDPVQLQLDMHALAIARGFVDNLINGDVTADPDGFDGLYRRFVRTTNPFAARQVVHCATGGTALDVLNSQANAQAFVRKLTIAMKYCNLGTGGTRSGCILMNENSWLGIQEAFRLAGYTLYTKDVLEETWPAFMGVPFVDVGLKLDKSTEIILDTYDSFGGGTTTDSTRLFVVRFGQPDGDVDSPGSDGMTGIQLGPLEVLGPEAYNLNKKYDYEWVLGLQSIGDDYSCAMLDSLKFTL